MATDGWKIILQLLEAYLELQKVGVTLHAIEPKNIFLSEDLSELVLVGIQQLVQHEGEDLMPMLRRMPYSNFYQLEYTSQPAWSNNRDLWSLGVVILEIIIGPEWIMDISSGGELYDVLEGVKPYIGPDLYYMINWMTLTEKDKVVKTMVTRTSIQDHAALKMAVEKIELAKTNAKNFQHFYDSMSAKRKGKDEVEESE